MQKDKYDGCCENSDCEAFDNCTECWDEWAERNPPITNADRIRAMSDEELADFVSSLGCVDRIKRCCGSCKKCTLEWIKQPAGEEDA